MTEQPEYADQPEQAEESTHTGPLLVATDLSYRYNSFHALSKASLAVMPGELIALVGRNGAGKSTLLRCLAGWTRATDGEVRIMGKTLVEHERDSRKHIILVPDTPPFYDELTAWEHMQFIAQAHGWQGWEEEAEDLLFRYGLLPNRDAFPFAFSREMRYKLALCMALLAEPKVLLLDEPLGPLDPVSSDDLWIELGRHRDDGMAILLSSHQLAYETHPDRYIVMEGGEIIAAGTPDALADELGLDGLFTLDVLLRAALRQRKEAPTDA